MAKKAIRIFTDGSGMGGALGSGFSWLREDTREHKVERRADLTNNEAEYHGVIAALKTLRAGAQAEILTDSQLLVGQLRGEWRVRESRLHKLYSEVRTIIERKRLAVKFTWIPRSQNLAGKLL